jgi:hypothetical protein
LIVSFVKKIINKLFKKTIAVNMIVVIISIAGFTYGIHRLKPRISIFRRPSAKVNTIYNTVISIFNKCKDDEGCLNSAIF